MEHEGKEKKIYHGIWIAFIFILLFPTACFFIFYAVFTHFTSHTLDIVIKMSLGFSGVIGTLFCLSCLLCGFLTDLLKAFGRRIRETVSYFEPFSKQAFSWYFEQFKHDGGIIIWFFFLILIAYAIIGVYGFVSFFSWYNAQ